MTKPADLFDRLDSHYHHRLFRPGAAPEPWQFTGPVAAESIRAGHLVDLARGGYPQERRAVLAELVEMAVAESAARDAAYWLVLGDLRRVAAQLTRVWRADRYEVDQAVAAAGWERLGRLAGRRLQWPDRAIVTAARDSVRDDLRRRARTGVREVLAAEVDPGPGRAGIGLDVAELIADAVRRGVVSADSARLVWATRVLGVPASAVAAAQGEAANRVVMRRWRAERALRSDRPTAAGWGRVG